MEDPPARIPASALDLAGCLDFLGQGLRGKRCAKLEGQTPNPTKKMAMIVPLGGKAGRDTEGVPSECWPSQLNPNDRNYLRSTCGNGGVLFLPRLAERR
jgi:hypothetical protein